jgi:hypothetical protein
MLENSSPLGGESKKETAAKLIDILHELMMGEDKVGGENKLDPMAQLSGLPGGDVWLK